MRIRLFTGLAITLMLAACGAPSSTTRALEGSSAPSVAASVVASPSASAPIETEPAKAPAEQKVAAELTVGRTVGGCRLMPGAYCAGADLRGADLSYMRLARIDLSSANLAGADLSGADLTNANLSSADLTGANLGGAVLTGVRFDGALLCHTKMGDRIDDSRCPPSPGPSSSSSGACTPVTAVGDTEANADRLIGSLALVPYGRIPDGMRPLDGASLGVGRNPVLYAVMGNTYGGDSDYYALPRASGAWAALPGLPSGTPNCLTWAIVTHGYFPEQGSPPELLPGEVLFLASPMSFVADSWLAEGLTDAGLGTKVAAKARSMANSANRPGYTEHFTGELVLFKGSALPAGFLAADGSSLKIGEHQQLFSALGRSYADVGQLTFRVPKMDAPAGYTWGIVDAGLWPTGVSSS